jgi:hypothetical protein
MPKEKPLEGEKPWQKEKEKDRGCHFGSSPE